MNHGLRCDGVADGDGVEQRVQVLTVKRRRSQRQEVFEVGVGRVGEMEGSMVGNSQSVLSSSGIVYQMTRRAKVLLMALGRGVDG